MTSMVEWGTRLPVYEHESEETLLRVEDHAVDIEVEETGRPYVFRVSGRTEAGTLICPGDFWFALGP